MLRNSISRCSCSSFKAAARAAGVPFKSFNVGNAGSSEAFVARKDGEVCIFDDYARLRAAAFDALAWYDDARMAIDTTTWERETEAEAGAPQEENSVPDTGFRFDPHGRPARFVWGW